MAFIGEGDDLANHLWRPVEPQMRGGVLCRGPAALRRTGGRHRSVFARLQRRHAREEDVACGKEGERTAGQDGRAASAWDFSGYPDACSSTSSCETDAGFEVRRWRSTHAGNRAGEWRFPYPAQAAATKPRANVPTSAPATEGAKGILRPAGDFSAAAHPTRAAR